METKSFPLIILMIVNIISAEKSFQVRLQNSGQWSPNEWIEFNGTIPSLREFTSCHWEMLKYFSRRCSLIWAYCSIPLQNKTQFNCIQLLSRPDILSANKDVLYSLYSHGIGNDKGKADIHVNSFPHRTWNHVCWTYSSITNRNILYFNGNIVGIKAASSMPVIPGTDSAHKYAFVVGQEMDSLKGDYSASQAFYGSISELNIWNKVLNQSDIMKMANNLAFRKGNVISWQKQNFIFHGTNPLEIPDVKTFFNVRRRFVIFPRKKLLSVANETCASYGGSVATPFSKEENEEILKIASKHRNHCLDEVNSEGENEAGIWLGLKKLDSKWLRTDQDSQLTQITYSNWTGSNWEKSYQGMCAYMSKDGLWAAERDENCQFLQLCTICALPITPVFSLKGLCRKGSSFQWQYYPSINDLNQIDGYEGFKRYQNISGSGVRWENVVATDSISLSTDKTVVGRTEWEWYEKSCTTGSSKRNLTLSSCDWGSQYTCDVGRCIPISQRCDNIRNCIDGSDEDECNLIDIPQSYDKLEPPTSNSLEPLMVTISIIIENINGIDTKQMMIDITMKVTMWWKDERLTFRNLSPNNRKLIKLAVGRKLWLPTNYILYQNEIVGQEYVDNAVTLSAKTNSSPLPFDVYLHREERLYRGIDTLLKIQKRVRIKTACIFNFTKFPFDKQNCKVNMTIKDSDLRKVKLSRSENPVTYLGGKVVGQFEVSQILEEIHDRKLHRNFMFEIQLARSPGDGLKMIFFPSLVLWLLAFLTLRIDVDDLTNRNRTSVTAMLVLVTLFGAISTKDDFPQTSGFKYIDLWILWYMISTFLIICHHVVLSKISFSKGNIIAVKQAESLHKMDDFSSGILSELHTKKKELANQTISLVFFIAMIIFNTIYFLIAT